MRIISVPLKAEKWQVDIAYKRMNLCGSLYNRLADEYEKKYRAMSQEMEYIVARNTINEIYALPEGKRDARKDKTSYRSALRTQSQIYEKYCFSEYYFVERAIEVAAEYKPLIPSRVAHYTIGRPLWRSFHGYLLGKTSRFKRKSLGSQTYLMSDGRSGIRLIGEDGMARRNGIDTTQRYYVAVGRQKGKRILRIMTNIDPEDEYLAHYLRFPMRWISVNRHTGHGGKEGLIAKILVDDELRSESGGGEREEGINDKS